ncbi:MAG: anhydro-N-acetylmuramic acid kinase [Bacteroidetes bacterium CG18_big_fil_WC_8_21_14_2_50_41_14]|nr:MAG: anhydro-N-acetylmuramic acid kinase [Bacteroidetes bacterium CG18_big_fil_WC_8_21_14_2_50_41_14]PJB59016.1 MAG: anhydro-N-acetylmuramic acid kinase [Bacteroidetes bacterium CG_4_9_14_3_um_filter_41_19]
MSGSSLDGLDIACCRFSFSVNKWQYHIEKSETVSYTAQWHQKLASAHLLPSNELFRLDVEYGQLIGELAASFIHKHQLTPEFISSHGHTIFHEPEFGHSFQLGKGAAIAKQSHLTTVSDFRNADIRNGGQGAPLVPIGDELLFSEYVACLNLGGIANISFNEKGNREGYDLCAANQLLNLLSNEVGLPFDEGGAIAASGKVDSRLLEQLNSDVYFRYQHPKSLNNQYVTGHFISPLLSKQISVENRLATAVAHISKHCAHSINHLIHGKVLVTGGGAHNRYLIESIKKLTSQEIVVPDKQLIDFKEALVFAFMGVLRIQQKVNCLGSVTGAKCDSIGGVIDRP